MARKRGLSGTDAEREFGRWLEARGWWVCRAVRTRFQRQDFWGAFDVLALFGPRSARRRSAIVWAAQVTTAKGATARRRRIEAQDWPADWRVSLVTHERVPDPANRRRSKSYWKIQDWDGSEWSAPVAEEA